MGCTARSKLISSPIYGTLTMTTQRDSMDPVSQPQIPAATYQAAERKLHRSSHDSLGSVSSDRSSPSTIQTTFIYEKTTTGAEVSTGHRTPAVISTRTETLDSMANLKHRALRGDLQLLTYLSFSVPALAIVSFLYTLLSLLPLLLATVFSCTTMVQSINSVHRSLLSQHAHIMAIDAPTDSKTLVSMAFMTFPISFLVSFGGIFAASSKLYSFLLSETDSPPSSLDRVMSMWLSWLCLFCVEQQTTADDLV